MNKFHGSRNILLASALLAIGTGLWVATDPFGSPGEVTTAILPNSEPGDGPVGPVVAEGDAVVRRSGPDANADGPMKELPSDRTAGRFPFFGDREVLPGVALRDLFHLDLSEDEVTEAADAIRMIARELTWDVYRSNPEVRDAFLTHTEAIELSEQGISVMKGSGPQAVGMSQYVVCPPSRAAELDELKVAGLWVYQSPRHIESNTKGLWVGAQESPRGQGELITEVRSDGTGIDVWNAEGEIVIYSRFSIPGICPSLDPPTYGQ